MTATLRSMHLHEPISAHTRQDFSSLRQDMTVQEALAAIRHHGVGERIIYFYVVDEANRLVGVVPTRRLLTAEVDKPLTEIRIGRVVAISLLAACAFGLSVPALLHALRLDPKIAAGPITLALTDISTLLSYFTLAALIL